MGANYPSDVHCPGPAIQEKSVICKQWCNSELLIQRRPCFRSGKNCNTNIKRTRVLVENLGNDPWEVFLSLVDHLIKNVCRTRWGANPSIVLVFVISANLFSFHSFSFFTCARKFMFSLSAALSHNLNIYEYLRVAPCRTSFVFVILLTAKHFRCFHQSWLKQNDSGSPEKCSTFFSCRFGGRIGGFFGIPSSLFHR